MNACAQRTKPDDAAYSLHIARLGCSRLTLESELYEPDPRLSDCNEYVLMRSYCIGDCREYVRTRAGESLRSPECELLVLPKKSGLNENPAYGPASSLRTGEPGDEEPAEGERIMDIDGRRGIVFSGGRGTGNCMLYECLRDRGGVSPKLGFLFGVRIPADVTQVVFDMVDIRSKSEPEHVLASSMWFSPKYSMGSSSIALSAAVLLSMR